MGDVHQRRGRSEAQHGALDGGDVVIVGSEVGEKGKDPHGEETPDTVYHPIPPG